MNELHAVLFLQFRDVLWDVLFMHNSSEPEIPVISVERSIEISPSKLIGVETVHFEVLWPMMTVVIGSQVHGYLFVNQVMIQTLVLHCIDRNRMNNSVDQIVVEVLGVLVAHGEASAEGSHHENKLLILFGLDFMFLNVHDVDFV